MHKFEGDKWCIFGNSFHFSSFRCPMDTCCDHSDKSVVAPGSLLSGLDENEQDLIETLVTAKQKVSLFFSSFTIPHFLKLFIYPKVKLTVFILIISNI